MLYNLSKSYLLPLLSEVVNIEKKFIDNIENTYLFDDNNEYSECLFVSSTFSFKNAAFTAYEHRLINNEAFVTSFDIDKTVVYVFKFPEEYLPEYYALQRGEYSKFGNDAKDLIIRFWTEMYGTGLLSTKAVEKMRQVLCKDPKLKVILEESLSSLTSKVSIFDQELASIPNVSSETFRIAKYKV
jgi:hypothetical protein